MNFKTSRTITKSGRSGKRETRHEHRVLPTSSQNCCHELIYCRDGTMSEVKNSPTASRDTLSSSSRADMSLSSVNALVPVRVAVSTSHAQISPLRWLLLIRRRCSRPRVLPRRLASLPSHAVRRPLCARRHRRMPPSARSSSLSSPVRCHTRRVQLLRRDRRPAATSCAAQR